MKRAALTFGLIVSGLVSLAVARGATLGAPVGGFEVESVVIGGRPVAPEERIARVTVRLMRWGQFACSGTLIAPNLVLTAAHCVEKIDEVELRGFFVGFWNHEYVEVESFKMHPRHRRHNVMWGLGGQIRFYDLAVLKLKGNAPRGAETALLPSGPLFSISQLEVILAGFGRTSADPKGPAGHLHVALTRVTRQWETKSQPPHLYATRISACKGDSGGPLYLMSQDRFVVMGVHSAGNCKPPHNQSRSEDVHSHVAWIHQVANELLAERSL